MSTSVAEMTGAKQYKRPESLKTNEIRFNGKDGTFALVDLLGRKEGEKPEQKSIGTAVELTFLKIRRKLSYYDSDKERFIATSEHNHKEDMVFLFGPDEKGYAHELREEYQDLRTQQIVYCLYNGEVVRLIVKGSSLGSKSQSDERTAFYNYLQNFGNDEHVHQYITKCVSMTEKGKLGTYETIHFERGEKLSEEQVKTVEAHIERIHTITKASDEHYQRQTQEDVAKNETKSGVPVDTTDYPEGEIDPDDIPF